MHQTEVLNLYCNVERGAIILMKNTWLESESDHDLFYQGRNQGGG